MSKLLLFVGIIVFVMLFAAEATVSAQIRKTKSAKTIKATPAKENISNLAPKGKNYFLSQIEQEILQEINLARTNPMLYVTYLEDYRKYYNGKNLSLPNQQLIVTNEGLSAVDDAIKALKSIKTVNVLESSELICKATKDHLQDMVKNTFFGHKGSDGSMTDARLNKYIYGETIRFGENLVMAGKTAREVVISMLIDDGVPSRSHRKNVLDPEFKFVGLSNGSNNQNGLSVVIFATDAKQRNASNTRQNQKGLKAF